MEQVSARSERSWLLPILAVALLLQVAYVNVWPHFPSPNERGRAYQALAVVERGTLSIDAELDRFGAMEDVASHDGKLYPNKAPGLLPLLVPAAWLARALAAGDPGRELALTLVLGRLVAASLPFLLVALLLERSCARWPNGRTLAIVAVTLASPLLTASLLLFSHGLSAWLLLAAAGLLRESTTTRAPALAGALLAWSFTAEYPTAVPALVLVLCSLRSLRLRGVVLLALGAASPLLALAAYNAACFGAPLALSSGHEAYPAFAELTAHGVFGIGWPTLTGLGELLVSPTRGLLVWVPVTVAVAGPPWLARDHRRAVLPGLLALLASVVVMAGYPNRHGGWFAGPRYLVHGLPLVVPALAAVLQRWSERRAAAALLGAAALWGLAATWLCLVSFPFPPEDYPLPWVTLAPDLLTEGLLAPSWIPAPLVAWAFAALAAAAVLLVLGALPRRSRAAATLLAVLALAAATRVHAPRDFRARLEAAVLHDVYLGRRGRLEALAAEASDGQQRRLVATWIARRESQPPP